MKVESLVKMVFTLCMGIMINATFSLSVYVSVCVCVCVKDLHVCEFELSTFISQDHRVLILFQVCVCVCVCAVSLCTCYMCSVSQSECSIIILAFFLILQHYRASYHPSFNQWTITVYVPLYYSMLMRAIESALVGCFHGTCITV